MFGELGKLNYQDGLAQCHICGKFFGHLGGHIKRTHFVEADDYKKEFGLKMTIGLIGLNLAEMRRSNTEHLRPFQENSISVLKNLTPQQRQKTYVSLQEKQEQHEIKLINLKKAKEVLAQKHSEKIEMLCPNCGKAFPQSKHKIHKRKFCSRNCYFSSPQIKDQGHILRKSFGRGMKKQHT